MPDCDTRFWTHAMDWYSAHKDSCVLINARILLSFTSLLRGHLIEWLTITSFDASANYWLQSITIMSELNKCGLFNSMVYNELISHSDLLLCYLMLSQMQTLLIRNHCAIIEKKSCPLWWDEVQSRQQMIHKYFLCNTITLPRQEIMWALPPCI